MSAGQFCARTCPPQASPGPNEGVRLTEVPATQWSADFDEADALDAAPRFHSTRRREPTWRRLPGLVRHVFTHFPLELSVYVAQLPSRTPAPKGMRWVALEKLAGEALPSVMRKVVAHALGE